MSWPSSLFYRKGALLQPLYDKQTGTWSKPTGQDANTRELRLVMSFTVLDLEPLKRLLEAYFQRKLTDCGEDAPCTPGTGGEKNRRNPAKGQQSFLFLICPEVPLSHAPTIVTPCPTLSHSPTSMTPCPRAQGQVAMDCALGKQEQDKN